MPTVIDSLIITLGLDAKDYLTGQKQAREEIEKTGKTAGKANKELEKQAKDGAEAIRKMRNEVLGLAAAFIGMSALKRFVEQMTSADAATARMAKNVGMSARELSIWQGVADRSGGTAEGMAGSIKGLVSQFQQFSLTGQAGPAIPYFRALGVAIADTHGKMRPIEAIMDDLAERLSGMDAPRAQALGAGLGLDEGTVNVLMQGPAKLREMRAEQERLNALTKEDGEAAIKRQQAWRELVQTAVELGRKILTDITPALLTLAAALKAIVGFFRDNVRMAEALGVAVAAVGALKLGALLGSLAAVSGGLSGAVGLAATLARTLGVLGIAGGGGYALGSALYGAMSSDKGTPGTRLWEWIHGDENAKGGGGGSQGGGLFASLERLHGLPSGLLDSVWRQESGRGKNMVSPAGAKGHFGFMPGTAAQYGIAGRENDLEASAGAAARMYSHLLKKYGNLPQALAAYNWGEGNVDRKGMDHLPSETSGYISSVMRNMGPRSASSSSRTSNTDVSIGQITIATAATDAVGIAGSIGPAVANHAFVAQANSGLN